MNNTQRALARIPDDAWQMIESAAKLLEAEGFIVRPGVYKHWVVGPSLQGMGGGYMAFLIP